jgi:hypothetical protein
MEPLRDMVSGQDTDLQRRDSLIQGHLCTVSHREVMMWGCPGQLSILATWEADALVICGSVWDSNSGIDSEKVLGVEVGAIQGREAELSLTLAVSDGETESKWEELCSEQCTGFVPIWKASLHPALEAWHPQRPQTW